MKLHEQSYLQHPTEIKLADDNHALVAPIHQSVKYYFETYAEIERLFNGERQGYLYSRVMNPTVRMLEKTLAKLQGCDDGIALGSGVAAITHCLWSLLRRDDHVVIFYESYAPGRIFVRQILERYGVSCTVVHIDRPEDIARAFIPGKTRLVFFESPTNPTLKIADIESIVALAHQCGAIAIMDNTFAGPHSHKGLGVDIYIHSLTKYAIGFGDGMGGVILSSQNLIDRMRRETPEFGGVLDPHVANTCQRGLKTYFLRFRAQSEQALDIANALHHHPRVSCMRYPGHTSHPQHSLAKKQCADGMYGGVVSFAVGQSKDDMIRFLDRLKLIKLTASLGTTESLIAPSKIFYTKDLDEKTAVASGILENSVRLSVGLEARDDLLRDLTQAMDP